MCSNVVCEAAYVPNTGLSGIRKEKTGTSWLIQKEIKYNLYHSEVRGDVLRPPHGKETIQIDNSETTRPKAVPVID